jgi:hypothetical protein
MRMRLLLVGMVSVVACVEPAAYGPCRDDAVIEGPTLEPAGQLFPAPSVALDAGGGDDLVVTFDGDGIERTARFPLLGTRVPSLLTGDVTVVWEAGDYVRAIRVEDADGRLLLYGTTLLGPTIVSSQAGEVGTALATAKDNVEAQGTCREASDVGYFIPVVIHADGGDVTLEAGNTVDFELDGHPMHAELPWATHTHSGFRDGTMLIWDRTFEPVE